MRLDIPVDPDAPEARRWLEDELAKPEYQAAKPTWWDLAMKQLRDWIAQLLSGPRAEFPVELLQVLGVVLVVAIVVVGLLVFGVPRLRARRRATTPIFDGDRRDLTVLREAAEAAARRGDWALAIEERFRALVRALVERDLVSVHPGTTAHAFALAAATPFPGRRGELETAGADFDAVRYLGRTGDEAGYRRMTELETELAELAPADDDAAAVGAASGGVR